MFDLAPQQAGLDALYGPTTGDLDVELWVGDPDADGAEVSGGGYAPGELDSAGWSATDSEGVKRATAPVVCGTSTTEEWSGTVTHFVLRDGSGDAWGSFPLSEPLEVGGVGSAVSIVPAVFFGTNLDNN